jgi:hypothetical protein
VKDNRSVHVRVRLSLRRLTAAVCAVAPADAFVLAEELVWLRISQVNCAHLYALDPGHGQGQLSPCDSTRNHRTAYALRH